MPPFLGDRSFWCTVVSLPEGERGKGEKEPTRAVACLAPASPGCISTAASWVSMTVRSPGQGQDLNPGPAGLFLLCPVASAQQDLSEQAQSCRRSQGCLGVLTPWPSSPEQVTQESREEAAGSFVV